MNGHGEVRSTKGGGDEPWKRGSYIRTVRHPKFAETNGYDHTAIAAQSTLNVDAQEFVPRAPEPPRPQLPTPEDVSYLAEAIEVLTLNPGRYQEFLPPIEDIVETVLHNKSAVSYIIDVVIEQCIAEDNFRYTGARLCRDLTAKFYLEFLTCLLDNCGSRFLVLQNNLLEARDRGLGLSMLLAELFLQITLDGTTHIQPLAAAVQQVLQMLLAVPAYDTIRAVCQILKLCGPSLEATGITLQPIFLALEGLVTAQRIEENSRRMIAGLLQLRNTEWLPQTPEIAPTANANNSIDHYNEPVFYSPDGQVMSEEERSFLLDNIPVSEDLDDYIVDNEMDDEASAAFDEFVAYSEARHPGFRH